MRLMKSGLLTLALCCLTALAGASPADPKNGVEYLTLGTPQNTDSHGKIEVIEFFAYYCPHCYAFEPALASWVKKQGSNIVFKRIHVPRDESTLPQQRLFFTLESMGLLDQYHNKIFQAMHVDHLRLSSDEQIFDLVEKLGIDRTKFIDAYRSFGLNAKLRRASVMMEAYKIDSWPTVAIDGRYLTSPSQANEGSKDAHNEAQLDGAALKVMDSLVAKSKAEKK